MLDSEVASPHSWRPSGVSVTECEFRGAQVRSSEELDPPPVRSISAQTKRTSVDVVHGCGTWLGGTASPIMPVEELVTGEQRFSWGGVNGPTQRSRHALTELLCTSGAESSACTWRTCTVTLVCVCHGAVPERGCRLKPPGFEG